jgi:hypothetical protein
MKTKKHHEATEKRLTTPKPATGGATPESGGVTSETTIAREIDALRDLELPSLAAKYRDLFEKEAKIRTRGWLERKVAWKLQEARSRATVGHVAPLNAQYATLHAMAKQPTPISPTRPRRPGKPAIGATIVRRWHGRDLHLKVVDAGYEFDGVVYQSLSAAAQAATGAHWNGRLFWGLVNRRGKK